MPFPRSGDWNVSTTWHGGEHMPDDEFRYELDDGVLIVSPAPSTVHQLAVARLTVILSAACPAGLVVLPGVGVNINKFQHRMPDVAVVRAGSLESFFQETPPELVVEVASERYLPGLRHPRVLDRRAVQGPSGADRLRASFGRLRTDRPCHRRRGVWRGGSVPGNHRAVPARNS
jgi:Putative restriction endonuclease